MPISGWADWIRVIETGIRKICARDPRGAAPAFGGEGAVGHPQQAGAGQEAEGGHGDRGGDVLGGADDGLHPDVSPKQHGDEALQGQHDRRDHQAHRTSRHIR
ncbi:hypothetical protein [Thermocatellispora tengchongensis]|uniref:hypothetical protein n=1 Tax=Thermocatellispora tengchongensis TaxID=1073253 RepID=UPI003633C206